LLDLTIRMVLKNYALFLVQKKLADIQSQFNTSRDENSKREKEIRELTSQTESRGNHIESLKLELSVLNTELQKLSNESKLHQDSLKKQVCHLTVTLF